MNSRFAEVIKLIDGFVNDATESNIRVILLNKKAESLISLGKLDEAEALLKQISEIINKNGMPSNYSAISETNEAFLFLNRGRNDIAEEKLQSAINKFEDRHLINTLEGARTLNILGLVYLNNGKYNQAQEQMQRALDIRKEHAGNDKELIAASYNDLGLVYSQIEDNKAIEYYSRALNTYRDIHGDLHPKIAIAKTNLAIIYRKLGRYNEALNNFESALKIWETVYPGAHPNKAFVIQNEGETYVKMGATNIALENFNKALSYYRQVYGEKHPEIANVLNEIGNVKISQNNYKESLGYYQAALVANVSDFNNNDVNANPQTVNYFNGNVLLYSLLFKAEALESQYYGKTIKFGDLKLALNTLILCDSLIDILRQHSINENDKISLGVIASGVYSDGVRIANAMALNTFNKKYYREVAFFFAEKSKGAVLQDAIADTNAKSFAGIPASMLAKESELKSSIATVSQKIAMMTGGQEMQVLRKKAFELKRDYESFVRNLEKNYPEYFNLKFNPMAPSVLQVQQLLDPATAVLSYFIDDKNSRLYIFLISYNHFRIFDEPITEDFDRMITGLRNSLYYEEILSSKLAGNHLYEKLIPRIPLSINSLIIIPAGRLSIVPFEALVTKYNEGGGYSETPFLINRYSVRYEFSAGLLLQKLKANVNSSPSIFLCAPVTFPASEMVANLPGTMNEVDEISGLFSKNQLIASLYTGQKASESEIKSGDLKKYSLIHLATHGFIDEADPELSCVYFQPNEPEDDGKLYAGEIYNLQLNANLVTLSACKTGLGKLTKGEGVIGLSRALIYAGARNIIVSFWNVADKSTAELMKDFYQYQIEDPHDGFSNNLRKAKLDLLKSEKYSAPYFWAPFILIGY